MQKVRTKSLTGKASASMERGSPSNEQAEKLKFLMRLAFGAAWSLDQIPILYYESARSDEDSSYCFMKSCEIN